MIFRRQICAALVIAALSVGLGTRQAQASGPIPVASGWMTARSDKGDWIGQGKTYSFRARALTLTANQNGISVSALTHEGLGVGFVAPTAADRSPRRLKKGVYKNAQRFADVLHPGLDASAPGRGCNQSTGYFAVLSVIYGPYGYVRSFHATFEFHCEGLRPALRGEVKVTAPPPPPRLKLMLTFDASRTTLAADGINLEGTIACTQTVVDNASVTSDLSETFGGGAVGSASITVHKCGPKIRRWRMTAASSNGVPFTADKAKVKVRAGAIDPFYTEYQGQTIPNVGRALPAREVVVAGGSKQEASTSDSNSDTNRPTWTLVIVLVIVATTGWSLLVAGWAHRKASARARGTADGTPPTGG
jgi:hypothetical protein